MDLDATADGPAVVRSERPREYAQWLTCTACAVAWIGMWSQERVLVLRAHRPRPAPLGDRGLAA